ncbi:MAG: hypothetical protein RI885_166 [Actinomycetota bacterium]
MPEGHSVHRIARQFGRNFVGRSVSVSSPQGRFAEGARELDGRTILTSRAVGKQMFLEFDGALWMRVHLGLYGAWDFAGDILTDESMRPIVNRRRAATAAGESAPPDIIPGPAFAAERDGRGRRDDEDSLASIGAPRLARIRMSEDESGAVVLQEFPPEPVGAVRVRLLADDVVADLRGPTKCEVLTAEEVQGVIDRLGPDPLVDPPKKGEARFVETVSKKRTPIGLLLMDQSVVSGIGNIYRAELLFRARIDPHTPGKELSVDQLRTLWKDWSKLLRVGVEVGQILTIDAQLPSRRNSRLKPRSERHWVYHRTGLPCRVCGTPIAMEDAAGRKLYWCPTDQV